MCAHLSECVAGFVRGGSWKLNRSALALRCHGGFCRGNNSWSPLLISGRRSLFSGEVVFALADLRFMMLGALCKVVIISAMVT